MKTVIASVLQEASAKYIFTVNPLPNLQKRFYTWPSRGPRDACVCECGGWRGVDTKSVGGQRREGWAEVANLFLMCCREPRHLNCPFTMMVRRLHSASHSSMLRCGQKDKGSHEKPLKRVVISHASCQSKNTYSNFCMSHIAQYIIYLTQPWQGKEGYMHEALTCERWVQQHIFLSLLQKWFSTGDAWSEGPCPNLVHPIEAERWQESVRKEENKVHIEMTHWEKIRS